MTRALLWTLAPLALLATLAPARPQPPAAPTLIIVNGNVWVGDGTIREAVAVSGSRIEAVGTTAEIQRLRTPRTQVVDAAGRTVAPGFIDSHVHLMLGGESLDRLNLRGARTLEESRGRVRAY